LSGLILFIKLPDEEPIAVRFIFMTIVQFLAILSLQAAFIYTHQSLQLILHGLFFSFFHFLIQTFFLIRIQKN